MLLRYAHKDMEDTVLPNGSVRKVVQTHDQTQGKLMQADDQTSKGKVAWMYDQTPERNGHTF
jgi:hypothetical protein